MCAGRIIGLCLLQNEVCPLPLSRHVLKFILGRRPAWHDLAFFDPTMYESLRLVVHDSEMLGGSDIVSSLDLTFSVQLCPEEVSRAAMMTDVGGGVGFVTLLILASSLM